MDEHELRIERHVAEHAAAVSAKWAELQADYPSWELTTGGTISVSGPGTIDYQARRGGVVLRSGSVAGLRRELGAQPAVQQVDDDGPPRRLTIVSDPAGFDPPGER